MKQGRLYAVSTPPEMTSATLLFWIALGITLQLMLWLGSDFLRHWGEYRALRTAKRKRRR